MVILAALLSTLVAIGLSRVLARVGPGRLVPRLFALSGVLLLVEWVLAARSHPVTAVLFYLHYSCLGALLISGFWGMVTERFDARSARATIGRIAAGGSAGGLLGGILPAQVGASLPVTAMLPILAALHFLSALLVLGVRPTALVSVERPRSRPASVSVASLVARSNSRSPTLSSSRRTDWLTAGWVRCSFMAALEKLRSAATLRNTRNSLNSTALASHKQR